MAKWTKVYVPGKGDRWTDGNGNYRYTNPALKDNVKSAASSLKESLSNIASGYQKAGERTANRLASEEKAKVQRGFGSRQRSERTQAEAAEMTKPKPKPKPQPKPVPKAEAKPKPKPIPKEETQAPKPQAPKPQASKPQASKPQPKPVPKAESKPSPKTETKPASKASETYKDGGKGLYQGSKEYRDKVGGSGNPLLNRLRRDMGRDEATGEKPNAIPKSTQPASKKGSSTPSQASKPMTGGSFNERNLFDKKKKNRYGGGSYA